ncbi:unnamed protein product, partial [Linum tenue]
MMSFCLYHASPANQGRLQSIARIAMLYPNAPLYTPPPFVYWSHEKIAFQRFTLGLRLNGYTEESEKGVSYVGGNFYKMKVRTRPMLEELHQMCTQITCMDGTRR